MRPFNKPLLLLVWVRIHDVLANIYINTSYCVVASASDGNLLTQVYLENGDYSGSDG